MNTTTVTIGTKPVGTATGTERWATIREDDGTIIVTAYRGWGILDEATFRGPNAETLAPLVAAGLIAS